VKIMINVTEGHQADHIASHLHNVGLYDLARRKTLLELIEIYTNLKQKIKHPTKMHHINFYLGISITLLLTYSRSDFPGSEYENSSQIFSN
jgi:hypothetical protein